MDPEHFSNTFRNVSVLRTNKLTRQLVETESITTEFLTFRTENKIIDETNIRYCIVAEKESDN